MQTLAKLVVLCGVTASIPAWAQRIEFTGRVSVSGLGTAPQHPIGDPRYVAVSDCDYGDPVVRAEVLDLQTRRVVHVDTTRAALIRRFGVAGGAESPECQLLVYSPKRAAFLVREVAKQRYWYTEIDNGVIGRTARVAYFSGDESFGRVRIVGVDPREDATWFAIVSDDSHSIALRRLDLKILVVTNEATITMPARAQSNGFDDSFTLKASADFTRFALAEYEENGLELAPPARTFVVDVTAHTQFWVPAMSTTYAIAFSPDNHYMFLGSSQEGTIARVDLVKHRIDGTLAGPALMHHLVVSPNGAHLFALASSKRYRVYDIPSLLRQRELAHVTEVAPAAEQMFGGGTASGGYFVIEQALPETDTAATLGGPKQLVIARFVD